MDKIYTLNKSFNTACVQWVQIDIDDCNSIGHMAFLIAQKPSKTNLNPLLQISKTFKRDEKGGFPEDVLI